jgi:hypothetical protein
MIIDNVLVSIQEVSLSDTRRKKIWTNIYLKKQKHIYIQLYITYSCRRGFMPLTRKARIVGSSLVITIPSQLAKAHDINDGDELEIIPAAIGEFKIRKLKKR